MPESRELIDARRCLAEGEAEPTGFVVLPSI